MIFVLFGGASSGKSELAEKIAVKSGGRLAYVATAKNTGSDMAFKIANHQKKRAGMGFVTIEKHIGLTMEDIQGFGTVLIECISNWTANEIFSEEGLGDVSNIYDFISRMEGSKINFVIVTNDIFGCGLSYSKETVEYMKTLGEINMALGRAADIFIEVFCGVGSCIKGKEIYAKYI